MSGDSAPAVPGRADSRLLRPQEQRPRKLKADGRATKEPEVGEHACSRPWRQGHPRYWQRRSPKPRRTLQATCLPQPMEHNPVAPAPLPEPLVAYLQPLHQVLALPAPVAAPAPSGMRLGQPLSVGDLLRRALEGGAA